MASILALLSTSQPRVQAGACSALARLLQVHPELSASPDLASHLDAVVGLLSSKDQVGGDKSESPALEAAFCVAGLAKNAEARAALLQLDVVPRLTQVRVHAARGLPRATTYPSQLLLRER